MLKGDLVNELAEMGYCKNQASVALNDFLWVIAKNLAEGKEIKLRGFGTFKVTIHKGHRGMDANTKEIRMLEDYAVPSFRPGENLREAVKTGNTEKLYALLKTQEKE